MSKSYTYGTTPEDVIREALPHKYEMSLNREDMLALLAGLGFAEVWADGENDSVSDEQRERMGSLRSAILDTIGIEEI
jgi:hypothetical protein